jgi:hypothetical protein
VGQPVVVAVTPILGRGNDIETVQIDVASIQPEDEREDPPMRTSPQGEERWRDLPRRAVAFELQAIIGGDLHDSDVAEGVLETPDHHPRQFALSDEGVRFRGLRSGIRPTGQGESILRPRSQGEESGRSDRMVLNSI